MKIELPRDVSNIIKKLEEAGYEAYAVGGCVRDSILNKVPDDWDITTSAKPLEIKKIFKRTVDTGIKHGTVTVLMGGGSYEVTTFRIDGNYTDGRHPDRVEFTPLLREDLRRRDFTINAMAYNDRIGLVDEFFGLLDLKNNIISCVGNPNERLLEDALRMLRAIRFAAQLDFKISEETIDAIIRLNSSIEKVSKERITKEIEKLILSNSPKKFYLIYKTGLLKYCIPKLDEAYTGREDELKKVLNDMSKAVMKESKQTYMLRLAILMEVLGSGQCKKVLRELKLDNETVNTVSRLVEFVNVNVEKNEVATRYLVSRVGHSLMPLLLEMRRVRGEVELDTLYEKILKNKDCTAVSELDIDGNDLIAMGFEKGVEIGRVLAKLLELVIENPKINKKELLTKEVLKYAKK